MLPIGDLAARTGLSVSAIRFYEARGLLTPLPAGIAQRRFMRSDIRRLSFIQIAQQLGFTIGEIGGHLASLPEGRTPTQKDWARISRIFRARLDQRIAAMTHMRGKLDECIGCGCLSLKRCALYNPQDRLGQQGSGPRLLRLDA
jgi:MerR family redox-sensitive transcriptional activator SoxR